MVDFRSVELANEPIINPQFEYKVARKIADNLIETLEPFCEIINIAGSVRRQKSLVKDIEIVCVPKKVFFQTELFGNGTNIIVPEFQQAVKRVSQKAVKGSINGRYMQIQLKSGITLDLFLPQLSDYYRQYAIRTGSGDYSRAVIATAWRKKGWCGTNSGLRKVKDCYQSSTTWICNNLNAELPPVWQSEEEFFDWLGLKWTEPFKRNV